MRERQPIFEGSLISAAISNQEKEMARLKQEEDANELIPALRNRVKEFIHSKLEYKETYKFRIEKWQLNCEVPANIEGTVKAEISHTVIHDYDDTHILTVDVGGLDEILEITDGRAQIISRERKVAEYGRNTPTGVSLDRGPVKTRNLVPSDVKNYNEFLDRLEMPDVKITTQAF